MISALGERQQEILRQLQRNREGLTIEELEARVGVTRTAVVQHLTALEADGYVGRGALRATGGRPVRAYVLTSRGIDLFPKQYSWFAALLMKMIASEFGPERSQEMLESLAGGVAATFTPRLQGLGEEERLAEVVAIMNELAFDAALEGSRGDAELTAANCVYHHLAAEFPQVCQFDIALLAELTGKPVTQEECIVRGGSICRFKLKSTFSTER